MVLDLGSEAADLDLCDIRDDDDAVRIADVDRHDVDAVAIDVDSGQVLVDSCLAHVDGDLSDATACLMLEGAGHTAAKGVEREPVLVRVAMLAQEFRKDAHTVAALLCL